MTFTKADRQRIAQDYAARNGGKFDPKGFVDEVRSDPSHPAYEWFDWDKDNAAEKWWVEQARRFVQDIRITYEVRQTKSQVGKVVVEYPAFFSPHGERKDGGGYLATDIKDPTHLLELTEQARRDLDAWINRYRHILGRAGISIRPAQTMLAQLAPASLPQAAE